MKKQNNSTNFFNETEENSNLFDVRENVELYLKNWYLFLISVILCLFVAYFALKYVENQYLSKASILIDQNKSLSMPQSQDIQQFFGRSSNNVGDQIYVIKSVPNVTNTVNELGLDIMLSRKTSISKRPILYYQNAPIIVEKIKESPDFNGGVSTIINIYPDYYTIDVNGEKKKFLYGQLVKLENKVIIKVNKNEQILEKFPDEIDNEVYLNIVSKDLMTLSLINSINVEVADKLSNVLILSYKSNNLQKAKDILNSVISQYSTNSVEDKRTIAKNTANFIDDRISFLTGELSGVEKNLENFKRSNKLTDITTEAQNFSNSATLTKTELAQAELQFNIVNMLNQSLKSSPNSLLPSNLGLEDQTIAMNINNYNNLLLQKNRYEKTTTSQNPEFVLLQENINSTRNEIANSLKNQKNALQLRISSLNSQSGALNSAIGKIPGQERQYREIFRQQQTKEALFLYLLQKREEIAIQDISIQPDFKVINYANGLPNPVSPNKRLIYLTSILIGLVLPIGFIYGRNLLNTKIHNVTDLEKAVDIPIIGTISKDQSKTPALLGKNDRTSSAESLRLLITNVEFAISDVDKKSKTMLLTSTLSGEGKTYIAANLAAHLAHQGYKVVLLGLDIRAPKLQNYFHYTNLKGATHYVRNENLTVEDVTNHISDIPNLDVIVSGNILPNFIDILTNKRIDELFKELNAKYDYVIVDSAPVGLVSDTFNISKYIDICLYVVRAEYLDKRMLNVVDRINKEKRFKKLYLILNGVDYEKKGYGNSYGYGYGYGYGEDPNENKKNYRFWTVKFWKDLFSS